MLAETLEADPSGAGGLDDGGLVHAGGQMCEQMESGGDPADTNGRQVARQRRDQGVPAAPVGATGAPQVAIELAALDEVRKRELLDHGQRGDRREWGGGGRMGVHP